MIVREKKRKKESQKKMQNELRRRQGKDMVMQIRSKKERMRME